MAPRVKKTVEKPAETPKPQDKCKPLFCGLVMPISAIDGCSPDHWSEVKSIISESIESIEVPIFQVKLVSDADDIGVIQKRIVQNIYSADIVVCDVSGKNPNVMFELGMRLAFDKPTIIVKDDKTDYSFDTGIIEHVQYPRDLRFQKIIEFKELLADKTKKTYKASQDNANHSTFLKNFGKFQVASLSETELTPDKMLLATLQEMQNDIASLRRNMSISRNRMTSSDRYTEAVARVTTAVTAFREREKIPNLAMIADDPKFIDIIERESGAPRYFTSKSEFVECLDSVIRNLDRN